MDLSINCPRTAAIPGEIDRVGAEGHRVQGQPMLAVTERVNAGPGVARDTHQKFPIVLRKGGFVCEQVGGPSEEALNNKWMG